jgi:hypothetical protein
VREGKDWKSPVTAVTISPKPTTPVSEWDVPFRVVIEPITPSSRLEEPHDPPMQRTATAGNGAVE